MCRPLHLQMSGEQTKKSESWGNGKPPPKDRRVGQTPKQARKGVRSLTGIYGKNSGLQLCLRLCHKISCSSLSSHCGYVDPCSFWNFHRGSTDHHPRTNDRSIRGLFWPFFNLISDINGGCPGLGVSTAMYTYTSTHRSARPRHTDKREKTAVKG